MSERINVVIHSSRKRTLLKAVTYRVLIVTSDLIVVYLLTHRFDLAIGFTAASNVASAILYYFHERFWSGVRWGKHAHRAPDSGDAEETGPPV